MRNGRSCRSRSPVLFLRFASSGSRPPKLSVSVTTDQLARSGLIAVETDSLGGREPENENDNFGRCSLGRVAVNWMMKCDGRLEVYYKKVYKITIFYVRKC